MLQSFLLACESRNATCRTCHQHELFNNSISLRMCLSPSGTFDKSNHFMNQISHHSYLLQDNSSRLLHCMKKSFRALSNQVCLVGGYKAVSLLQPLLLFSYHSCISFCLCKLPASTFSLSMKYALMADEICLVRYFFSAKIAF